MAPLYTLYCVYNMQSDKMMKKNLSLLFVLVLLVSVSTASLGSNFPDEVVGEKEGISFGTGNSYGELKDENEDLTDEPENDILSGADIVINYANGPGWIHETDDLEVEYEIENVGDETGEESFVDLRIDGSIKDTDYSIELTPGETHQGTLIYDDVEEDYNEGETIPWTVELWDFDDSESGQTEVVSYHIINDWHDLSSMSEDLDADYTLMDDLDENTAGYSEHVGTGPFSDGWEPIGEDGSRFTGTFDGNGFTISDLYIDRPTETYIGLFGLIDDGEVHNIGVVDAEVNGDWNVGGLVGWNDGGTISNSYVTGEVTGERSVGGLIGVNWGTISNSFSTADVTKTGNWNVGGLVGSNLGDLSNSYATGNIDGNGNAGGLVGYNEGGTVIDSYALGDVEGDERVGGLVGRNTGTVSKTYATGTLTGDDLTGGLIGWNDEATVEDSFWDVDTSGMETSDGGEGKTTGEMKDVATFTDLSTVGLDDPWDFVGNPNDDEGDEDIWNIDENTNDGYPILSWESLSIYDWYDLDAIRDHLSGNYVLMNDLDENSDGYDDLVDTNIGWAPIGSFSGDFDGNGYEIQDLYIDRPGQSYVGLFGYIEGSNIENLKVSGEISGDQWVGGLAGYITTGDTTIENVVSEVDVTGSDRVGGLVGVVHNGNRIIDSAARGPVDGPDEANIGGLVGRIHHGDVIIENSYAVGSVNQGESGDNVGGLIGFKHPDAQVLNSFWDVDTTGQDTSDGGTGVSTADMMAESTFTDAGWDITIPGTWAMAGYPHLQFERTTEITDLAELQLIMVDLDDDYTLMNDIDASGTSMWNEGSGFDPIGDFSNSFEGTFDGNGHEISDLYIDRPEEDYGGLFGRIVDATIENVKVTGSVTADGWVGGLVGLSGVGDTVIENTVVNVDVIGNHRSGGLVGIIHSDNLIRNSVSHGSVTGPNAGGLVGNIFHDGVLIETSFSTGSVNDGEPDDDVGGLVGYKETGSEVVDSFWDVDTSGIDTSSGGTGKSTEEMQNFETFTDTDTEGLDEPWDIEIITGPDLEDDYPYLSLETVNSPVWYIEQTSYAASFDVSVDDIAAGQQPVIEIYDAVDQSDEPLEGDYDVTIEIDDEDESIIFSFENGEADYTWEVMTDPDDFNAEVTIDGVTESDTFTVYPGEVDDVNISSVDGQTTVTAGEDLSFNVEALDEYGNLITDEVTDFDWDNAEDGVFNKEIVGDHDVTATYDGVTSDPVTITVEPGDVDYIEISPQDSTIDAGESETYTATAYDEYDNEIGDVTDDTDWDIDADAGGSWDDNVYTSENEGTWTITGIYEGETDETQLTVDFDDDDDETPPDDEDEIPPDDDDETVTMDLLSDYRWILLALIIMIVIAVVLVLMRGKKGQPTDEPYTEQPYEEQYQEEPMEQQQYQEPVDEFEQPPPEDEF